MAVLEYIFSNYNYNINKKFIIKNTSSWSLFYLKCQNYW